MNGVLSLRSGFTRFRPRAFPFTNGMTIICPFWDDVRIEYAGTIYHNRGLSGRSVKTRVMLLIQESLGVNFHPTGVFTATWDNVSYHDAGPEANSLGVSYLTSVKYNFN